MPVPLEERVAYIEGKVEAPHFLEHVYLLKSRASNRLYIGFTNDLRRRIQEHNEAKNYTTRRLLPVELVYYEAYRSKEDALNRERQLKRYGSTLGHLKRRLLWSLKSAGFKGMGRAQGYDNPP